MALKRHLFPPAEREGHDCSGEQTHPSLPPPSSLPPGPLQALCWQRSEAPARVIRLLGLGTNTPLRSTHSRLHDGNSCRWRIRAKIITMSCDGIVVVKLYHTLRHYSHTWLHFEFWFTKITHDFCFNLQVCSLLQCLNGNYKVLKKTNI